MACRRRTSRWSGPAGFARAGACSVHAPAAQRKHQPQPVPKWMAAVKPEGLTVGIQSVASPTGRVTLRNPTALVSVALNFDGAVQLAA